MSDFQTEDESYPSEDDLGRAKPDLYDWQHGSSEPDAGDDAPTRDEESSPNWPR